MNIVDAIIILFILMFGVYGFKNGFIRSVVSFVGIILVFSLSFALKNPIAEWLSLNLPFFNFWGEFRGVTILNVVIYQTIAFFIVFSILMILYEIVVKLSKFVEKILKCTIILGIPSKILGGIVGLIEGEIIATIILMLLSLPIWGMDLVQGSKVKTFIFEKTPIVGTMMGDTSKAIDEIVSLKDDFTDKEDKSEFNRNSFDIMLKYNVIKYDYAKKLVDSGKLKIDDVDSILDKYK